MLYKYADPTDALPALPLADDEMEFEYYQHWETNASRVETQYLQINWK
jgi:hypothetical protein